MEQAKPMYSFPVSAETAKRLKRAMRPRKIKITLHELVDRLMEDNGKTFHNCEITLNGITYPLEQLHQILNENSK